MSTEQASQHTPSADSLSARVAEAVGHDGNELTYEDRSALERLVLMYGLCADFGMPEHVSDLFEDDGRWDGRAFRFPLCHGSAEISAWFQQVAAGESRQMHIMETPVFTPGPADDTAAGLVPFNAMESAVDGKGIIAGQHAFGIYEDQYRKRDGRWRIQSRTLHLRLVRR